jgi:hypothetical protein
MQPQSTMFGDPRLPLGFWSRVQFTESCWLWMGARNTCGYGCYGRRSRAHRVAYETLIEPIAAGLTVDHLCRVRHCVNPDHLEIVTNRENILRGNGPTARHARATHCEHGHPFDEANTYKWKTLRQCRACGRIRQKIAYHRNKALKGDAE